MTDVLRAVSTHAITLIKVTSLLFFSQFHIYFSPFLTHFISILQHYNHPGNFMLSAVSDHCKAAQITIANTVG